MDDLKALNAHRRRVLLLSDDNYRFHMRFKALIVLDQSEISVFAFPSHRSGLTQPLDVDVFVLSNFTYVISQNPFLPL